MYPKVGTLRNFQIIPTLKRISGLISKIQFTKDQEQKRDELFTADTTRRTSASKKKKTYKAQRGSKLNSQKSYKSFTLQNISGRKLWVTAAKIILISLRVFCVFVVC
jgi:hypothetical protein